MAATTITLDWLPTEQMEGQDRPKQYAGAISALEFTKFFITLRGSYVLALDFLKDEPFDGDAEKFSKSDLRAWTRRIKNSGYAAAMRNERVVQRAGLESLPSGRELQFLKVSQNSPLKLTIRTASAASIIALSLAVSVHGGKVDLETMTFTVNAPQQATPQSLPGATVAPPRKVASKTTQKKLKD